MTRALPHSAESEAGLLGAVLLEADRVMDVCAEKHLRVDDFYVPAHRIVFAAMGTMFTKQIGIDVLTLADRLNQKGKLTGIGGAAFLDTLTDACATVAHSEFYIDQIRNHSKRRKIIMECREGEDEAFETEDPEELRSRLETDFTRMDRYVERQSLGQVFDTMADKVERGQNGEEVQVGHPTGYDCLDQMSGGGMRDGVYWLTGEEGTGKTSLKGNIIKRQLLMEYKVASLTLEMSIDEEISRLTGIYVGDNIPNAMMGKVQVSKETMQDARDLIVGSKRLFLEDQSVVSTASEFWSWCRRMVHRNGVDVICLDPLYRLKLEREGKLGMEEKMTLKSAIVSEIATKLKVPLIVVNAINDAGKNRGSRMQDYDGAGHWQLIRDPNAEKARAPDYVENLTLLSKKARYGIFGKTEPITFYGATGRFEERHDGGEGETESLFDEENLA